MVTRLPCLGKLLPQDMGMLGRSQEIQILEVFQTNPDLMQKPIAVPRNGAEQGVATKAANAPIRKFFVKLSP